MKFKNYYPSIIVFLLMFPFRLPISVGLVFLFNWIAGLAGDVVPDNVMCANVVITKFLYNAILATIFIYSIESSSRKILGRKPKDGYREKSMFWWTAVVIALLIAYLSYDCFASVELFWAIIGKPLEY